MNTTEFEMKQYQKIYAQLEKHNKTIVAQQKIIDTQEKKLKQCQQAILRMEQLMRGIDVKAKRGVDQARKNTMEVSKLKSMLKQGD